MDRTDNVVDIARYRARRQARRTAEMMWMMYACRAGQGAFLLLQQRENGIREA
ncbi:hypothetical protein D3C76_1638280 [compost metagenome]